jgi:hypothetical protein
VGATRDAILNLIHLYAECIDRGDYDGIGELFAEGTIAGPDGTPLARGREQVARLYERTTRRHEDGTPRTHHVTSNLILEVDEPAATARGRCYYTVLQAVPGLPLQPIVAGRYHDTFARSGGAWSFRERRMFVDLTGELGQHLLIDLPGS